MHVVSSVFTLSHRMLTVAADKGSHLMAHLAVGSNGRERPTKQHAVAPPIGTHAGPPPRTDTSLPTAPTPLDKTAPAGDTSATTKPPRHHAVRTRRAATAPVTPAMVRRWAHEHGIQVADRGRIPRSVMERYMADIVQAEAVTRPARRSGRSSAA